MASLQCIVVLCLLARTGYALIVHVAYMSWERPNLNNPFTFGRLSPGVTLALDDYRQRVGNPHNITIRLTIKRLVGPCDPGVTMKTLAPLVLYEKPDVLLGLGCSIILIPIARYIANWNLPYFPYGGTNPILGDKKIYNTMTRIQMAGDKIANAYVDVFRELKWQRAAMITSNQFCDLAARGIHPALVESGVTITEWIRTVEGATTRDQLSEYLDRIKERARIIIPCFFYDDTFKIFLRLALEKGMTRPNYVMMAYKGPGKVTASEAVPGSTPAELAEFKEIMMELNLKYISMEDIRGKKYEDFYDLVPIALTRPPWNFNQSYELGIRGSYKALDVYDMSLAFYTLLDEVVAEGGDYRDGNYMMNKMRNRVVNGIQGRIRFNDNADRQPNFWIYELKPGWPEYKEVIAIDPSFPQGEQLIPINGGEVNWGTEDNKVPPDTPVCGFNGELCVEEDNFPMVIGLALGGIVVLSLPIVAFFLYRRQKEQEELMQTVWKINFAEIKTSKAKASSVKSMDSGVDDIPRHTFTEVGMYRGNLVAIIRVNKSHITVSKDDMKELKSMKDMSHVNIANFVGACIEPPNISYVMTYYTKGSLQDIIGNESIGLDWMFKTSLLSDLAKGMSYLHSTDLKSHGRLKSSCCLVDSRWQLKVSSYGLHNFKQGQDDNDLSEERKYINQLWTAPELLRTPEFQRPCYGTQAGDVYSFAIIAQEVIYRASAYFTEHTNPKDVVTRIVKGPFRPKLPKLEDDTPENALELVTDCWQEDPSRRPSFDKVIKQIKAVNLNKTVDIMETLMQKLEKYANNLEDIVNKRTAALVEEKKKTEKLLESMLPVPVVKELVQGRTVDPEMFAAVTVLFSDVVGFVKLSLESSPFDIVALLNSLYFQFDAIITSHDVYKVETISDSYMCVSGLPIRNGDAHVSEIANLALDMMSEALTFKINHRPGLSLQLRIGFHTGPCAAGVVGLSMPRYCLFGDTVNMSSRMETNGKALKIQMSKFAYAAIEQVGGYIIKPRGEMQIKGKGLQMTYWLLGRTGYTKPLPAFDQ